MQFNFPHIIENCVGERIEFQSVETTPMGDKVFLDAYCDPGCGPTMHTHFKQEENLTVVEGKMGYQILGEPIKYLEPGESILFKRGTPHKFWAEGNQRLHCKAWLMPVNTVVFFLSALYEAQNKSGSAEPERFDGAYLMTRYASEYDIPEIPRLVKKTVIPLTYQLGRLLGKYDHFRDAPDPIE